MITVQQHIDDNWEEIQAAAREYAKSYGCSYADALRDVKDEYVQGYCEAAEAVRTDDSFYGRE